MMLGYVWSGRRGHQLRTQPLQPLQPLQGTVKRIPRIVFVHGHRWGFIPEVIKYSTYLDTVKIMKIKNRGETPKNLEELEKYDKKQYNYDNVKYLQVFA